MIDDINFTKYSKNKIFKNLYKSNEIFDEEIEDTNQIIFRVPKDLTKIDNMILCYDGQNLFDSSTSHFGTIFNLESLINNFEDQYKKNFLIISVTSNSKRQFQYNPYPIKKEKNFAEEHIKNIVLSFIPSVKNFLGINFDQTKFTVAGASMGGLMSIKTSIIYPEFENIISLSPAFWFGYPGILYDIKNLGNNSTTYLYTGKKEGHIFGDHVKNIFPKNRDLDFSNNDNFYFSGVKNVNDSLELNKKNVKFFIDENGLHNETSWASAMPEIFLSL
jgi:predicted alpha/beta superfamily hydrolase